MYRLMRAAICGLLMMAPGIAPAATLTATFGSDLDLGSGFAGGAGGQTAFVINFNDSLGSSANVLEGDEFVSFAWVNNPFALLSNSQQFRTLLANAPTIPGLIEGFLVPSTTNPFSQSNVNWIFREAPASSTGSSIAASAFTYSITPANVVPLPAAGVLLLGALAGLIGLRRKGQTVST